MRFPPKIQFVFCRADISVFDRFSQLLDQKLLEIFSKILAQVSHFRAQKPTSGRARPPFVENAPIYGRLDRAFRGGHFLKNYGAAMSNCRGNGSRPAGSTFPGAAGDKLPMIFYLTSSRASVRGRFFSPTPPNSMHASREGAENFRNFATRKF